MTYKEHIYKKEYYKDNEGFCHTKCLYRYNAVTLSHDVKIGSASCKK